MLRRRLVCLLVIIVLWAFALPAWAGVSWYHATLDSPDTAPYGDKTSTELGYHLGAGMELPPSPKLHRSAAALLCF